MKKVFIIFLFFAITSNSHAQTKYADSLKTILAGTIKPIERFNLLNKIVIAGYFGGGDTNIDSLTSINMYKIAQQLHNDSLLAISYDYLGVFFLFNKNNNTSALEYLFKGLPLAEKAGDKRRISSLYLDIAHAYFNLNNPAQAMLYNQKAGANLPDTSSPEYDISLMQYLYYSAQYYAINKNPDSLLHFAQALNEANQRRKTNIFQAAYLLYSGIAYELKGDQNLAENFYRKANMVMDSSHFYPGILQVKEYFTSFLLHTNHISEAKSHAQEVMVLGRVINNEQVKESGASLLRRIYDNQHQADSGNYYFRMESAIKDSIFSQDNINKLQALAFSEQLRMMDEASKKAAEEEQRKENIQYALIALGIIIFITLFLLLSRTVIVNENLISFFAVLGLLVVFEFLNLLIHPWLAHFTNDSPVLMLLALVLIAALIIPLHHRLEHWIKEKMIEKNKAIRLHAAKKTMQMLSDEKILGEN